MGAVSLQPDFRIYRWKASFAAARRVSRLVFLGLWRADLAITLAVVALLTVSAVGVVYSVHLNRDLFSQLNHLETQRDAYQRTWSQLLLEQSALSAHTRIEQRAVNKLNMKVPGKNDIEVVQAPN